MTLVQLRYLVAIVDAGLNISLAAQQTHSTQPGLSKQLGQIEDELGFNLFVRRGKRLEALTAAGGEVIERARIILSETANIQAMAVNRRKAAKAELRIATTGTPARYVLADMLPVLRAKFPRVALHVAALGELQALERLEEDAADIAIVSAPAPPKTRHLALPLYRWDLLGLAPTGHPLARQVEPLSLAGLAAAPLVTYESALDPDSAYARAFAREGLEPVLAATAREPDIIKTLVRSGAGVGLLAEMAWTPKDADLARLNVSHLFESRTAWAVVPRDRVLQGHVLELITTIAPHLDRAFLRENLGRTRDPIWPEAPPWRDLHGPAATSRSQLRLVAQA